MTKADEEFIWKLNDIIQANLHNPEFSMEDMADAFEDESIQLLSKN